MILTNCKVKWAKVHQVDRTFTPAWSVQVYLNSEQIDAVKQAASEVSEGKLQASFKHDDDGTFITCSRKEKKRDGNMNKAPRVVDMQKQVFTEDIGNGSICNVITNAFAYDTAGKKGVTMILEAVQVVKWEEYKGNEDFEDAPVANGVPAGAEVEKDDLPF